MAGTTVFDFSAMEAEFKQRFGKAPNFAHQWYGSTKSGPGPGTVPTFHPRPAAEVNGQAEAAHKELFLDVLKRDPRDWSPVCESEPVVQASAEAITAVQSSPVLPNEHNVADAVSALQTPALDPPKHVALPAVHTTDHASRSHERHAPAAPSKPIAQAPPPSDHEDLSSDGRTKTVRYSVNALRNLGKPCRGQLPPVRIVKAMFIYELFRETDAERLFRDELFRHARDLATKSIDEQRLVRLETRMEDCKRMENDVVELEMDLNELRNLISGKRATKQSDLSQDNEPAQQECATTKEPVLKADDTAVAELRCKLDTFQKSIDLLTERHAALASDMADVMTCQYAINTEMPKLATTTTEQITFLEAENADLRTSLSNLSKQLAILTNRVLQQDSCTSRLEDLVRALTTQNYQSAASVSVGSSASLQRVPAQLSNGQLINIGIPKGSGFNATVAGKENKLSPHMRAANMKR